MSSNTLRQSRTNTQIGIELLVSSTVPGRLEINTNPYGQAGRRIRYGG